MSELERFRRALRVSIEETSTLSEGDGTKYTMFHVRVESMYGTFEVSRRYRQFDALNLELSQQAFHMNLPTFPKKRALGKSGDPWACLARLTKSRLSFLRA